MRSTNRQILESSRSKIAIFFAKEAFNPENLFCFVFCINKKTP